MKKDQTRVVIVDLDNTLISPCSEHSFINDELVDYLYNMMLIHFVTVCQYYLFRDSASTGISRVDYEKKLIHMFQHDIVPGISEDKVVEAYSNMNLSEYRFIQPVLHAVQNLQAKGYKVIVVTAVLVQFQHVLSKILDFDHYVGLEFELRQGVFTNKVKYNPNLDKLAAVEKIIKSNDYTWQNSYAFGDSMSDFGYLQKADNPFAINPKPELLFHAIKNAWPIVMRDLNDYYVVNQVPNASLRQIDNILLV